MSFGRVYASNPVRAMERMMAGDRVPARVSLRASKYAGTKVMPFTTFGVTAAIEIDGDIYLGTGVAPLASSGGVREPQAVKDLDLALNHVARLSQVLNQDGADLFDPLAIELKILGLDQILAGERGLIDPRPTSGIGSEVAIATSLAMLEAQAAYFGLPTALAMRAILLKLQEKEADADGLIAPLPKFNLLNFGAHSGTKRPDGLPYIQLQETMVAPIGAQNFEEALFMGIEVLQQIIKLAGVDNVGFEAGISPALTSPEQVYELVSEAISKTGYTGKVVICADAAASEFSQPAAEGSDKFSYNLYPGQRSIDAEGMVRFWENMTSKYDIISIEDGMNSEDPIGWQMLMAALGDRIELQGDDLFVTDADELYRLREGANSILVKPNQAGTIIRTLLAIIMARTLGYTISPSHRSGKVPGGYGIIPELCLASQAEWIKAGAPRRERLGFYNNVLTSIAELKTLGIPVGFAGPVVAQRFSR